MIESSSIRLQLLRENKIEKIVSELTLEEKVGQVFISFFYGRELTSDAKTMLKEKKLGNIIYYKWSNWLDNLEKVSQLSKDLTDHISTTTGLPPLICTDGEGGIVERLNGEDFTLFPGNMALAATQDSSLAHKAGLAMGKELKAAGINLTLAPVVDINNKKENPTIGTRAHSDEPEVVIEYGQKMIKGFHEAGLLICLKHYSGHGGTTKNSHTEKVTVNRTQEELFQFELTPFIKLKEQADSIMSAHIHVPEVDSNNPVSLSPIFLTDMLRNKIGFENVIISDSLVMKGVVPQQRTLEETIDGVANAAIRAFNAGSDCLILGCLEWAEFKDATSPETSLFMINAVMEKFLKAVKNDEVKEEKLNASVKRILTLKRKTLNQPTSVFDKKSHTKLAQEICEKALTLVSPPELLDKVNLDQKITIVAPKELKNNFPQIKATYEWFDNNALSASYVDNLCNLDSDLLIFFSFNAHVFEKQKDLIQDLAKKMPKNKKLVFVGLRNPQDVMENEIHKQHPVFLTYSHQAMAITALFDAIKTQKKPTGFLPMKCLRITS